MWQFWELNIFFLAQKFTAGYRNKRHRDTLNGPLKVRSKAIKHFQSSGFWTLFSSSGFIRISRLHCTFCPWKLFIEMMKEEQKLCLVLSLISSVLVALTLIIGITCVLEVHNLYEELDDAMIGFKVCKISGYPFQDKSYFS